MYTNQENINKYIELCERFQDINSNYINIMSQQLNNINSLIVNPSLTNANTHSQLRNLPRQFTNQSTLSYRINQSIPNQRPIIQTVPVNNTHTSVDEFDDEHDFNFDDEADAWISAMYDATSSNANATSSNADATSSNADATNFINQSINIYDFISCFQVPSTSYLEQFDETIRNGISYIIIFTRFMINITRSPTADNELRDITVEQLNEPDENIVNLLIQNIPEEQLKNINGLTIIENLRVLLILSENLYGRAESYNTIKSLIEMIEPFSSVTSIFSAFMIPPITTQTTSTSDMSTDTFSTIMNFLSSPPGNASSTDNIFGNISIDSWLEPISVRPTSEEISSALEEISFEEMQNDNELEEMVCPIDLAPLTQEDTIVRIKHCKHTFKKQNIMTWFSHNVKCPICRYDIRNR